jgi:hypothetical protein
VFFDVVRALKIQKSSNKQTPKQTFGVTPQPNNFHHIIAMRYIRAIIWPQNPFNLSEALALRFNHQSKTLAQNLVLLQATKLAQKLVSAHGTGTELRNGVDDKTQ